MTDRFKEECFKALGVVSSPMVEEAWSLAWKAHEFGLSEVFFHFRDRINIMRGTYEETEETNGESRNH